jgi:hypothetical protein
MVNYQCGDVLVNIQAVEMRNGRITWEYSVILNEEIIDSGKDLCTPSYKTTAEAVNDLLDFMVFYNEDLYNHLVFDYKADEDGDIFLVEMIS